MTQVLDALARYVAKDRSRSRDAIPARVDAISDTISKLVLQHTEAHDTVALAATLTLPYY